MAKTKQAGSTRLGRDSASQRLGVKLFGGQIAHPGNILIRQRGLKFLPGLNVRRGGDDTLYAATEGTVTFKTVRKRRFDGNVRQAKRVDIIPITRTETTNSSVAGAPSSAPKRTRFGATSE